MGSKDQLILFWQKYPALAYGASLLIGVSAALFWPNPWNWILPFFWTCYLLFLKKYPEMLLIPAMAAYCYFFYGQMPQSKHATGIFSIQARQHHESPFHAGYAYHGTLYLPSHALCCTIHSLRLPPFPIDCDYQLSGFLEQRGPYEYTMKANEWIPISKKGCATLFSIASLRTQFKDAFREFLEKHLQSFPRTADFFLP